MSELEIITRTTSELLNFEVEIFTNEGEYICQPKDDVNVFSFWYLSQEIQKSTLILASYFLIEKYKEFLNFDAIKKEKIKKSESDDFLEMLPALKILPINTEHLGFFKRYYDTKKRIATLENNPNLQQKIDATFEKELFKIGYLKSIKNNIFQKSNCPDLILDLDQNMVKIGHSNFKYLSKKDFKILKWFANLTDEDRIEFQSFSIEHMRIHLNREIQKYYQYKEKNDLTSWILNEFERCKRINEALEKIILGND